MTIFHDELLPNQMKSNRHNMDALLAEHRQQPHIVSTNQNLGAAYYEQGQYKKARDYFAVSYSLAECEQGASPALVRGYAVCLIEVKDWETANEVLEKGRGDYPLYTDLWYLNGYVQKQTGGYSEAVSLFQQCLKLGEAPPEYPSTHGVGGFRAYYLLAQVHEASDDYAQAIDNYIRAAQTEYSFALAYYPLIRLLLKVEGSGAKAERRLLAAVGPLTASARGIIADAWFQAGEFNISLKWAKEAAGKGVKDNKLTLLQGRCLVRIGSYGEAISCLRRLYRSDLCREAFSEGCLCLWELQETAQIEELFTLWEKSGGDGVLTAYRLLHQALINKTPRMVPKDVLPGLYVLIENVLNARIERLLPYLLQLLSSVQGERPSLRLAKVLMAYGQWDAAAEEMLDCLERDRLDAEGFLFLGRICKHKGLFTEAEQLYRKAIILDSGYVEAYLSLAALYTEKAADILSQGGELLGGSQIFQRYYQAVQSACRQLARYQ